MAIHLFDGARAITGADPVTRLLRVLDPPGAGTTAGRRRRRLPHDRRLRFTFNGNWAGDGFQTSWTGIWRAIGERGSATWDGEGAPRVSPARASARGRRAGAVRSQPRALSGARGLARRLRAALRTGRVPAGECHDNLRTLAMCHAAVESAAQGEPVNV